jgi:hypothetical protein
MLMGMSESIKRAMRTLARNMRITRKIATVSRPLTKFNDDATGSSVRRSGGTEDFYESALEENEFMRKLSKKSSKKTPMQH